MHRVSLVDLLIDYSARNFSEQATIEQFLHFARTDPRCLERSNTFGHFTGSAWIVDHETRSHALLCHHRKLNCWLQLGGHADGESNLHAVSLKEAHEESGLATIQPFGYSILDIDVHLIPALPSVPEHWHFDVRFLFLASRAEALETSDESNALRWFAFSEISANTFPSSILRMKQKAETALLERNDARCL